MKETSRILHSKGFQASSPLLDGVETDEEVEEEAAAKARGEVEESLEIGLEEAEPSYAHDMPVEVETAPVDGVGVLLVTKVLEGEGDLFPTVKEDDEEVTLSIS